MNDMVATNSQASAGQQMLALIRTKYPQYHPVLAIADMAHDEAIEDHRIKLECHKTLLKHVSPELKSIEVKAEVTDSRRVIVSLFDGEMPKEAVSQTLEGSPQVTATEPDPLWGQLITDIAVAA